MVKFARWALLGAFAASALFFSFVVGYILHDDSGAAADSGAASSGSSADRPFDVLNDIYGVIQKDFVESDKFNDQTNRDLLVEGAINGLIQSLGDPHTTYIDPDSFKAGRGDSSGRFEGIGAHVRQDTQSGNIVIVTPFTGSPAEKAGIRPGDIILAVDGEPTNGWTVDRAVIQIRGQKGTTVKLKVRHSDGKEQEIPIQRAEIVVGTVFGCPEVQLPTAGSSIRGLDAACPLKDRNGQDVPDLAYLHIEQFTESTPKDVSAFLKGLDTARYRGLVLDVRRNPGGLLDATVQVADSFLDRGTVLVQESKDGRRQEYQARQGKDTALPIVVLMDETSASGAEVLAASLHDNNRAVLVGTKTFGKGTVNQLRTLPNGGALYVSVARWLTPNNNQIEGVGVQPDIEVTLTDADFDKAAVNINWDPQLFRAIEELQKPR